MSEAAASGFTRLLSDDRLTRRAVSGDEHAFAAIFSRYHQPLYRFCLTIVGNPEDAQDALQNTMAKVLRALPGEERQIELKPWLYRIAHNESIDLLRRRRETRQLDAEQIAPGYGLAEDAATRERLRQLIADLSELPERQREVLVLRELSGLDFEEIGTAVGASAAVARQTLYEARQNLRQMEAGREMSCAAVTKALSDGDGRVIRRRDVRAHLRTCAGCRGFRDEIKGRQRDFAAFSTLPVAAAAGMLHSLTGGASSTAGSGLAATLGGGAAKTIGASTLAKGVATAAVVAAVGVTAADRTDVIHLGLPGEKSAKSGASSGIEQTEPAAGDGSTGSVERGAASGGGSQAAHQGARRTGKEGPGSGRGHAKANAAPGTSNGATVTHSPGSGAEVEHPDSATKGQETAASHQPQKGGGGSAGGSRSGGRAESPPKPSTPAPHQPPKEAAPAAPAPQSQPAPEAAPEVSPGPSAAGEKKP